MYTRVLLPVYTQPRGPESCTSEGDDQAIQAPSHLLRRPWTIYLHHTTWPQLRHCLPVSCSSFIDLYCSPILGCPTPYQQSHFSTQPTRTIYPAQPPQSISYTRGLLHAPTFCVPRPSLFHISTAHTHTHTPLPFRPKSSLDSTTSQVIKTQQSSTRSRAIPRGTVTDLEIQSAGTDTLATISELTLISHIPPANKVILTIIRHCSTTPTSACICCHLSESHQPLLIHTFPHRHPTDLISFFCLPVE